MFIAVLAASSCQKQAIRPEEKTRTLTDKSASGSIGIRYDVFNPYDEKIGRAVAIESRQYVELSLYLEPGVARSTETLSAFVLDNGGRKIAVLEKFVLGDDAEDGAKKYISKTFPLIDRQTGQRIYYEDFVQKGKGYTVVIYDNGVLVGRAAIK